MTTETPATTTIGRMPTVAFSDNADYESLTTLLCKMDGFLWQVDLRDGTSLMGEVKAGGDDTITVTYQVKLDDVIRFVYM